VFAHRREAALLQRGENRPLARARHNRTLFAVHWYRHLRDIAALLVSASAEPSRPGACSRTQRKHSRTPQKLRPACSLACGPGVASSMPTARRGGSVRCRMVLAAGVLNTISLSHWHDPVVVYAPPEVSRSATSRAAARALMPPICLAPPAGSARRSGPHGPRTRERVPR
jgi:hypothetical protein